MSRQARLDAPGTLHHVMVRGIERTALFRDDRDRADFVARVAQLAERGPLAVFACGNISATARRGATHAARWQAEIPRWCR